MLVVRSALAVRPNPRLARLVTLHRGVSTRMTISASRARLEGRLPSAQGERIAVNGDAMLDVYLTGDVERISPEASVPVVGVRERKPALRGAAIVAHNVVAMHGMRPRGCHQ
jgi:hypothetical protein